MARLVFRCAVLLLTIYWFVHGSPCLAAVIWTALIAVLSVLHAIHVLSNAALRCTNCTDKLCSQYCGHKKA